MPWDAWAPPRTAPARSAGGQHRHTAHVGILCAPLTGGPPTLQAADIVRIVGIGRNEYIATMNKCKGKKLLWRVNKAIVREHLPPEPLPLDTQPWWIAHVVNLGAPFHRWHRLSHVMLFAGAA